VFEAGRLKISDRDKLRRRLRLRVEAKFCF
jgi:hypothetical protein